MRVNLRKRKVTMRSGRKKQRKEQKQRMRAVKQRKKMRQDRRNPKNRVTPAVKKQLRERILQMLRYRKYMILLRNL